MLCLYYGCYYWHDGCFLISDMFSCTLIIHVRFPGGGGTSAPEGRKSLGGSSRVLKAPGPGAENCGTTHRFWICLGIGGSVLGNLKYQTGGWSPVTILDGETPKSDGLKSNCPMKNAMGIPATFKLTHVRFLFKQTCIFMNIWDDVHQWHVQHGWFEHHCSKKTLKKQQLHFVEASNRIP